MTTELAQTTATLRVSPLSEQGSPLSCHAALLEQFCRRVFAIFPDQYRSEALLMLPPKFSSDCKSICVEQFCNRYAVNPNDIEDLLRSIVSLNRDPSIKPAFETQIAALVGTSATLKQWSARLQELSLQHKSSDQISIEEFFLEAAIDAYLTIPNSTVSLFQRIVQSIPIETPTIEPQLINPVTPQFRALPADPSPVPELPRCTPHAEELVDKNAKLMERVFGPAIKTAALVSLSGIAIAATVGGLRAIVDVVIPFGLQFIGTYAVPLAIGIGGTAGFLFCFKYIRKGIDSSLQFIGRNIPFMRPVVNFLRTPLIKQKNVEQAEGIGRATGDGISGFLKSHAPVRLLNLKTPPKPREVDGGENVLNAVGLAIRGKEGNSLISNDSGMYHRMWVTTAYVASSPTDQVEELRHYLEKVGAPPAFIASLYPHKVIETQAEKASFNLNIKGSAEVQLPISPGKTTLPLCPGHSIQAIEILDQEQKPIRASIVVTECRFGGATVTLPEQTSFIRYLVQHGTLELTEQQVQTFREYAPQFESYLPAQEHFYRETIDSLKLSKRELAHLDYQTMIEQGIYYSYDPFVPALQRRSGNALNETIGANLMGICDSLSYHVVRRWQNLDIPGLQLVGLVPDRSNDNFKTDAGHAQALLVDEAPQIFDPTHHASVHRPSSHRVPWNDRAETLLGIREGTFHNAYDIAGGIGGKILEAKVKPKGNPISIGLAFKRLWHLNLVPDASERENELPMKRSSFVDDHSSSRADALLARAVMLRSYKLGLDREILHARKTGEFEPVIAYLKREPKVFAISSEDFRSMESPKIFGDIVQFKAKEYALSYMLKTAVEGRIAPQSYDHVVSWASAELDASGRGQIIDVSIAPMEVKTVPSTDLVALLREIPLERVGDRSLKKMRIALINQIIKANLLGHVVSSEEIATLHQLEEFAKGNQLPPLPQKEIEAILKNLIRAEAKMHTSLSRADASDRQAGIFRLFAGYLENFDTWADFIVESDCGTDNKDFGHVFLSRFAKSGLFPKALLDQQATITKSYLSYRTETGIFDCDIGHELGNFERLGFDRIDLSSVNAKVVKIIKAASNDKHVQLKDFSFIGKLAHDSSQMPVTELIKKLAPEAPEVRVVKNLNTLLEHGGTTDEELAAIWNALSDDSVVERMQSLLPHWLRETDRSGMFSSTKLLIHPLGERQAIIDFQCLVNLVDDRDAEVLKATRTAYVLSTNHKEHRIGTYLEAALENLQFKQLLTARFSFDSGLLLSNYAQRVLSQASSESRYSALLKTSMLLASHIDPNLRDNICESLLSAEASSDALSNVLNNIPVMRELRTNITSDNLLESVLYLSALTAPRFFIAALQEHFFTGEIPRVFAHFSRFENIEGHRGMGDFQSRYWQSVLALQTSTEFDLSDLYESERRKLLNNPAIAKLRSPYTRYLSEIAAPVRSLNNGGDFKDHRPYQPGDDMRTVDWRNSARSEKLLVRTVQEDERRNLDLVFDCETFFDEKHGQAATRDFVRHLIFAERQQLEASIHLRFRGASCDVANVVCRGGGKVQLALSKLEKIEDFLGRVGCVLESEKAVLGRMSQIGWDIGHRSTPKIEAGRICFVSVAGHNGPLSSRMHSLLSEQGGLVATGLRRRRGSEGANV
jgi:hypothetical protein